MNHKGNEFSQTEVSPFLTLESLKGSSKQEAQAYLRLCAHGLSWTVNVCIDLKFSCGAVGWSLTRGKRKNRKKLPYL